MFLCRSEKVTSGEESYSSRIRRKVGSNTALLTEEERGYQCRDLLPFCGDDSRTAAVGEEAVRERRKEEVQSEMRVERRNLANAVT